MRFFIILVGVLLWGQGAQAQHHLIKCQPKQPPKINVSPSRNAVDYDFSKTKADLNSFDVDTVSPYGSQHKTYVSGLMSGSIELRSRVEFSQEVYQAWALGCLYIKEINVEINIDPTVFVASEYHKGSCMHNAVITHEHKHVREDQAIVNKYSSIIGNALVQVVESRSGSFGPYKVSEIPQMAENIQNSIAEVIKRLNQQMNLERRDRQQAIDSLEEYESIGKKCKGHKRH